jgi:hypothetical protein
LICAAAKVQNNKSVIDKRKLLFIIVILNFKCGKYTILRLLQ